MNKLTRLTALLLAMLMIFSTFATAETAYQVGGMTVDNWQEIVDSAEEKLFTIDEGDSGKEVTPPPVATPTPGAYYPYTDGTTTALAVNAQDSTTQMTASGVAVLQNAEAGQWQMQIGSTWINITGATGSELWATSAMMNGMESANFRKAFGERNAETGEYASYTNVATVEIVAEVAGAMFMMSRAAEDEGEAAPTVTPPPAANDIMTVAVANPDLVKYAVTINYKLASDTSVLWDPFIAQVGEYNPTLNRTVKYPDIVGYKPGTAKLVTSPTSETETLPDGFVHSSENKTMTINATISGDLTINVYYVPAEVNYTVKYYQEKISYPAAATTDEKYDLIESQTMSGYTESTIAEDIEADGNDATDVNGVQFYAPKDKYVGFLPLLYDDSQKIAAAGNTEVKVRYQRLYYLMVFDLDGGTGVDTIYAKYGSEVGTLATPTRTGYQFKGWTTDPTKTRYIEGEYDGTFATIPTHIPNKNTAFYAVWEPEMVKYTVVYWKENADNSNYSFWGQVENNQALAGDTVSGSDNIPTSITNATVDGNTVNERPYFTYNAAKTNKDVVVAGDGSTVVNVYYYRNTYTVYFHGISGTCAIEEHTHGTNCNSVLDCLQEEHEHNEECPTKLTCTLDEHVHEADCNGLVCQIPEHAEHTAECLICTKTVHENHTDECCSIEEHPEHDASCCTIPAHTHSVSCCTLEEHTHTRDCYTIFWLSCGKEEHTHGDGSCTCSQAAHTHGTGACTCTTPIHTHGGNDCNCDIELHYHSDDQGCYRDVVHAHTEDCFGFICGEVAHTHTDSCYAYTCGAAEHEHTDDCYRPCTKREHTHGTSCRQNSDNNVIYVVTAKYEQSIANVWPTAANFPNVTFRGWSIDGVSATAVSKRLNMTPDLCDTTDGLKYAEAVTGGSKTYLYYMFESFDQTSPANGNERILRNGKYYDKSEDYYQEVNSGGNWNQKEIFGMAPVSNGVVTSGSNVFLYYTRNRSNLSYYNVNGVVKTVSSIMYEQPLEDYKDSDGNLLSAYVPPYPSGYEAGAYRFKGWYTTPQCYDGTEYNFETATMPNGDLMLYAKWELITHKVKVYNTKEDAAKAAAGDTTITPLYQWDVSHGYPVSSAYTYENPDHYDPESNDFKKPVNGDWEFTYWFYDKNGDAVDDAFSFNNTRIVKDTIVWAGWQMNKVVKYKVYYVLDNGDDTKGSYDITEGNWVAAPTEDSNLAGSDITVPAIGGTDLYDATESPKRINYQEGYFPKVSSQDIYIDLDENANVFVFEYVQVDAKPYTVYYLTEENPNNNLGTETIDGKTYYKVAETLTKPENRKAVVTENYKPVSGNYLPDAFQKRLVITADSSDEDNVIIFWYTKDLKHTTLEINHYTVDYDGKTTQIDIRQEIIELPYNETVVPLTIDHYQYKAELTTRTEGGVAVSTDSPLVLNLPEGTPGVVLNLYYVEDPVTITYKVATESLNMGTVVVGAGEPGNEANETIGVLSGNAQGATAAAATNYEFVGWYSEDACETLVSSDPKYVPSKANGLNVEATYYALFREVTTMIHYIPVGPDNHILTEAEKLTVGNVNPSTENVKVVTGNANGSTATPVTPTYRFEGWYTDAACQNKVPENWVDENNKIVPVKADGTIWNEKNTTYYAKFVYDVGSLVITKNVVNETNPKFTPAQTTFTFTVTLTGENLNDAYEVKKKDGTVVESTWTQNGNDRTGTFALTATENAPATVVIEGILNGTAYTVTEDSVTGYTTTSTGASANIVAGDTQTASFTNTYKVGSLNVTKKVEGTVTDVYPKKFDFTLTLSDAASLTTCKIQIGSGAVTAMPKDGKFTLEHGQTAIITGIPQTVTYTVTENAQAEGKNVEDYFAVSATGETVNGNVVSGAIVADTTDDVTFTNTAKTGSLTITKKIKGDGANSSDTFLFTVTGPKNYSTSVVLTGSQSGKSVILTNLPFGAYTVQENEAWSWRYTLENGNNKPADVMPDVKPNVEFINNRTENKWLDGETTVDNKFN